MTAEDSPGVAFRAARAVAVWRYVAVTLTALTLGLGFAHVLELPIKFDYDAATYVEANQNLYRYFAIVGAPVEVAALIAAGILALLVRDRRSVFGLTAGAVVCLALALGVFFLVVGPANAQFHQWTPTSVPADWMSWRARWEYGHVVRACLQFGALTFLLASILRRTPPARR